MVIEKKSILTGEIRSADINISEEEYQEYLEGELLDIVAPDLCSWEKKFLTTGILPEDEE